MKMENRIKHVESVIAGLIFFGAVGIYVYRIFLGAEITDESFSISETYITVKGAVPIVETWSQSPTFVILMFPFLKLFLFVTGGSTAGIILYGRCLFFLFKLLAVLLLFLMLKKELNPIFIAAAGSIYIMEQGYNIFTFSYGVGSVVFLSYSAVLLAYAFSSRLETGKSRKSIYLAVLAGLCACACAIAHPSQIIYCIAMPVLLFLLECTKKIGHTISVGFTCSGALLALAVFCSLLFRSGLHGFLYGLDMVLNKNPYFTAKANAEPLAKSILHQLSDIWGVMQSNVQLTGIIAFWGIAAYLMFCWKNMGGKRGKPVIKRRAIIDILFASYWCAYVCLFFRRSFPYVEFYVSVQYLTLPAVFILPFYLMYKKNIPTRLKWFCFFAEISSCCWLLNAGVLTLGGYASRCFSLIGAAVAYLLLNLHLLSQVAGNFKVFAFRTERYGAFPWNDFIKCIVICCSIGFLFSGVLSNLYGYVYRDAPFKELDCKISEGVYKGLYTTRERAQGLLEIENVIRQMTEQGENVFFLDVVPFAYLMTDANAFTPSTWDISLYIYGFHDDIQYQSYFKLKGQIPDKIIYIDAPRADRNDRLSIEDPEHSFNDFVNENYILTRTVDDIYYPIRMYERKTDEQQNKIEK